MEVLRLLKLYNAGISSFEQEAIRTKANIYSKDNEIDPSLPVYLNNEEEEKYLIAGNLHELSDKYKRKFQSNLREILLVRLISALEVYLIEMIKEIFLKRKDLFHSGQKIEFKHSELLSSENITALWTKLINKECRKLQNQGFIDVKKFYKNNFNIDFNNFQNKISFLEKLHDQRHIFVHRLGKVDKYYQHKYNTTERTIKFSNDDFYEAVESVKQFGQFILEGYGKLTDNKINPNNKTTSFFKIYILNDDGQDVLDRQHKFIVEEQIIRLKDLIQSADYKGSMVTLQLYGKIEIIKHFYKILKKQEKLGSLRIEEKKLNFRKTNFSKNDLEKVQNFLPKPPYPIDIHKTIAKKVDFSNTKTYDIIKTIEASAHNNS